MTTDPSRKHITQNLSYSNTPSNWLGITPKLKNASVYVYVETKYTDKISYLYDILTFFAEQLLQIRYIVMH